MEKYPIKLLLSFFCVLLPVIPAFAGELDLLVAASLKDVMAELTANFSKGHPAVKFRMNFGASGALANQIASGAPADMFFSANLEWMDFLKKKNLIDEKSISTLAYNVLVFVGKPGLKVKTLQDVASLDKISIGSPKSVPAGDYAMKALEKAGIAKRLEGNLVMAKDVRACLFYADNGEVDGAFVYKTDAEEMAKNVKILFVVPQDLYPRVTYPMALSPAGSKKAEAIAFYRFMKSDKVKTVFQKHGFNIN